GLPRNLALRRCRPRSSAALVREHFPRDAVEPRKRVRRNDIDSAQAHEKRLRDDVVDEVIGCSTPHEGADGVDVLLVDPLELLHLTPFMSRPPRALQSA